MKHGLSEVIGSWKIIAMSLPTSRRRAAAAIRRRSVPAKASRSARDLRRPGQQAHDRQHGHALARPALAHDPDQLAGLDHELDAVDGAQRALEVGNSTVRLSDLEEGAKGV